jgi:hypothetical protein
MQSFQTRVTPNRRAGNRFIASVRRALQRAFDDEASKQGLTQAEVARRRGVNRSVVTRELRGVENLTLRSVAELAWAMGRRAELVLAEPVQQPGQNVALTKGHHSLTTGSPGRKANVIVSSITTAATSAAPHQ